MTKPPIDTPLKRVDFEYMEIEMETEHSPTPWKSNGPYIDDINCFPVADTLATNGNAMRITNADRIVACVNACEGIDSADLTHGCYQKLVEKHVEVHFAKQDIEEQRDELLEALREMVAIAELTVGWMPQQPNADGPLIKARAAIAKAEGWQFTPPESEGPWLISCGETAYQADTVLVEWRGGELWCTDSCIGTRTVLDYHDALTNARWKKAEGAQS